MLTRKAAVIVLVCLYMKNYIILFSSFSLWSAKKWNVKLFQMAFSRISEVV